MAVDRSTPLAAETEGLDKGDILKHIDLASVSGKLI